jgi:hypothetical protein
MSHHVANTFPLPRPRPRPRRTPLLLAVPLAVAAAPPAQPLLDATVSPPHFLSGEGNSSLGHPFGTGVLMRYLQIHDDLQGQPRMFRGVAVRPDGPFPGTAVADYTVTLSMWLSSASRLSNNIRPVFEDNHGADRTRVVDNRTFSLPGRGLVRAMPRGFAPPILFDSAFAHAGTVGLTWEVETHATTIGSLSLFHDAASGNDANPIPRNVFIGSGCRATGRGSEFSLTRSATFDWPNGIGSLNLSGSNAPANAPVIAVLGTSDESWLGIPLPLLIPGSSSNPSGPCHVYGDVQFSVVTAANAAGSVASLPIQVGLHPGLHGLNLIAQLWAIDANASLGLVTSRAAVTHFVAPFGAVPVSKLSQAPGGAPSIAHEFSLVMRFDHD